jgi:hypothetical protein
LRIAPPDCSVLLEQLLLPRIVWDLAASDEYVLGAGRELERIAGPHHDIRILARFERTEALGDTPDPRRFECHGAERRIPIEAVGDRVSRLLPQVARVVGVERGQHDGRARFAEPSGVFERGAQRVEAGDVGQRLDDHRHLARRELVGDPPPFGGADQDQLEVKVVGKPHRRKQVAGAVGVDRQR